MIATYCCLLLAIPAPSTLGLIGTNMLLSLWSWRRAGAVLCEFAIGAVRQRWLRAGAAILLVSLLAQLTAAANSWVLEWAGLRLGLCFAALGLGIMSSAFPHAALCRNGFVDGFRFVSWRDVRQYAWADDDPEKLTIIWDGAWTGRNDLRVCVPAEQHEAVERVLQERVLAAVPDSLPVR